ncbi:PRC-barrel domain-containing protein [Roseovarius sp. SCSIO 43702]|uniref:PRC-barrel domain-containing protein n=1 Tax=Roseovarius sp. SCSIO 43702 TaxID=2823043 RepID=UPI001C739AE0|nr:PRC-barrel domain-containing protein [Roseovarius sp. SCSIO 43702]QYX56031.1 PRC-barrel domain-containing protein [Roseovarius sp. SCSIO 43702]
MKLLTTSALALTLGVTGAMAQDAPSSDELAGMKGDLIRSRDITDAEIYTTNAADDEGWDDADYTAVDPEWNQIGEIEDLVLSKDGKMIGIVAEVGGFLDIGDKHVALSVDDVKLVPVDDKSFVYVTRYSEEQLEALPSVDEGFWD